jgi:hypothetical protein
MYTTLIDQHRAEPSFSFLTLLALLNMPEIHENTIGNKLCQLFIEQQAAADRILNNIYTDVTGKETCHCAFPSICPASQGHVHEILSNSPCLKTGVTGTEGTGLYPAMYSTTSKPIPVSSRGLVLQEAEIDARNYILKFLDRNKKECWIQVYYFTFQILCLRFLLQLQPLTHTVIQIYTKQDWIGTIMKVNKAVKFPTYCTTDIILIANLGSWI